jgi:anti-sigma regulatory factor (Ser/Thr protein kinase)
MTRLHFQPIQGKTPDIINTILQAEEMASVGDAWNELNVVVEELVVNVVNYSHSDYLDVDIIRDEKSIVLCFHDSGVPFNPLKKDPPDFSIPFEEREIGGLGIFIVKKTMDSVCYRRNGDKNELAITKTL